MTPHDEDSFLASFESMSIETQFNDSSNEANIYPPYTMSMFILLQIFHVQLMKNMKWLTILILCKCHTTFHITCNKDFKRAYGRTSSFLSMEKLWVGVKKFIHDMFKLTISIIEAPCLGMNIVFNKMRSLQQILQWSHINRSSFWYQKTYYSVLSI